MNLKDLLERSLQIFLKPFVQLVKLQDIFFTKITMLAMQKLGRSKMPIHPKNLYDKKKNIYLDNLLLNNSPNLFLDLGSGSGSELVSAIQKGWKVYGIEKDKRNIELSIQRLKIFNKSDYFIKNHNLEEVPLPIDSKSIKILNFTNVLEHLNNRDNLLKDINRILTDDGICLISIPNSQTFWKKLQRFVGIDSRDDKDHKIEYTKFQINQEINKAGLVISSKMSPIVPSLPIDGFLSLTAIISPNFYRFTQKIKRLLVEKNILDTIGWIFEVKKQKS